MQLSFYSIPIETILRSAQGFRQEKPGPSLFLVLPSPDKYPLPRSKIMIVKTASFCYWQNKKT